ncbi:MAG: hypothetical protein MUO87_03985 [Thermoplasmata archaeon]|nr:hypothetical protein [Thermoplasmata archaeon]
MGGALVASGVFSALMALSLAPEDGWKGLALFGLFVASLGAGIVSYSLLNTQTSLKDFREGKEPSSRTAAGLAAVGFSIIVFTTGYVSAAYYFGFSSRWFEVLGILLPLSMALIVASSLRRPRFLFREDDREMSTSTRLVVAFSILLVAFVIQVAALCYGYWKSLDVLQVGWMWFILISPLFVIACLVILWRAMGRPWIPGGYGKRSANDGKK